MRTGGLDADRVAQIVNKARGSGYRITTDHVLTADHVVAELERTLVRFCPDQPGEWEAEGVVIWRNRRIDVAILRLDLTGRESEILPPVRFGRLPELDVHLECSLMGYPRFKLREYPRVPGADNAAYRDSAHVRGRTTPWSNRREGTLAVVGLPEPAESPTRPDGSRPSPWEGISGSALWSDGLLIGVVQSHHRTDGLGQLAASRVDQWHVRLATDDATELCKILDLRCLDELPTVAAPRPDHSRLPAEPGRLGEMILEYRLDASITSLCFGPDRSLFAATNKGPIRQWHSDTGVELGSALPRTWIGTHDGVRVAATEEVGLPVLYRSGNSVVVEEGNGFREIVRLLPLGFLDRQSNGRYIITNLMWHYEVHTATGQFVAGFDNAVAIALSGDGTTLAVASGILRGGKTIRVYQLPDLSVRAVVEPDQAVWRSIQIALSYDGSRLGYVTARAAGVIDVESGNPIMPRAGGGDLLTQTFPAAMGLICTPGSRLLWLGNGKVWQLRGNRRDDRPVLPRSSGYVRIAINRDGTRIAASDRDGWVRVWEWID
ncbi:trypsin-like peptidase domain-containing protein [Nocardia sp. NPDC057668]|uniref:trypsin-like peptidase domain-containing protein n=1 Tax=Nocardia sp. NPDC057668 TaxID=3346202 RepID=UPI00366D5E48